jgi:hypothetical protein
MEPDVRDVASALAGFAAWRTVLEAHGAPCAAGKRSAAEAVGAVCAAEAARHKAAREARRG